MNNESITIPTKDTPKPHNDKKVLLEAMKYRYATKKFDPEKIISDEDFETLLEAARLSPTSFGMEPWKILDSERTALDWTSKQAYIVMANMMTMAAYMGIDSCPLEGFNPADMTRLLGEEHHLFDTRHYGIAVMAAFGYRAETPHRDKSRKPLSESVEWVR